MVAIVLEDVQITVFVTFRVEPSVNFPVAVNCRVEPFSITASAGLTVTETSAGAVTVKENVALSDP